MWQSLDLIRSAQNRRGTLRLTMLRGHSAETYSADSVRMCAFFVDFQSPKQLQTDIGLRLSPASWTARLGTALGAQGRGVCHLHCFEHVRDYIYNMVLQDM